MRKKFMVLTALSMFAILGLAACKGNINKEHDMQEIEVSTEQNTEDNEASFGVDQPNQAKDSEVLGGSGTGSSHSKSIGSSYSVGTSLPEDGINTSDPEQISGESSGITYEESSGVTNSNNQGKNVGISVNANENDTIGEDKALEIALEKAGLSKEQVTDISVEADADAGTDKYEVEFKKGKKEYNYDIDMHDGTVYESESEMDD